MPVRSPAAGVVAAVLIGLLAGCTSGHPSAAGTAGSASTPATSTEPVSQSTPVPSPSGSAVSIPPYLCDATDQAQNAADAYMGALSAGDERQATACVLPGTVPAATTRGLLATTRGTAVYLPRTDADGPTVFGYQGNGKSIDVTVTKQSDGKYWVTRVAVRNA